MPQQFGYDRSKRNLWPAVLPDTLPAVAWTATGFDSGAPVYIEGNNALTVTGTSGADESRIACYNATTGATIWTNINLPAGAGRSWLHGVNATHVICARPSPNVEVPQALYGLVLATGALGWTSTQLVEENYEQRWVSYIDASGNVWVFNPMANTNWFFKLTGTTGATATTAPAETRTAGYLEYGLCGSLDEAKLFAKTGLRLDLPNPYPLEVLSTTDGSRVTLGADNLFSDSFAMVYDNFGAKKRLYVLRQAHEPKLVYELLAIDVAGTVPTVMWRRDLVDPTAAPRIIFHLQMPQVDAFGNIYCLSTKNLLRQYDKDGTLVHEFTSTSTATSPRDVLSDSLGKILVIDRSEKKLKCYNPLRSDPYTPLWTITMTTPWYTWPALTNDGLYVNENGTLTKYNIPWIRRRNPAEVVEG